jgi:hypothetical protein
VVGIDGLGKLLRVTFRNPSSHFSRILGIPLVSLDVINRIEISEYLIGVLIDIRSGAIAPSQSQSPLP